MDFFFQSMSPLTSANWESFYNSFFHEKRTVSRGIEPMTSNLKLSTQCTEPSSHVKSISLTLSQILRFLDKPTNHFFCLGWWQPPWSTYPWVSSWIPAMNLPIFCCTGHFTTPSSIKKVLPVLGLNPRLPIPSTEPYPLSHQAMYRESLSDSATILNSWT